MASSGVNATATKETAVVIISRATSEYFVTVGLVHELPSRLHQPQSSPFLSQILAPRETSQWPTSFPVQMLSHWPSRSQRIQLASPGVNTALTSDFSVTVPKLLCWLPKELLLWLLPELPYRLHQAQRPNGSDINI